MTLSIIIVSYNVKYFLEQCLFSVKKAISNIQAEVIIVDNQSTDNSIPYLQAIFPQFTFYKNDKNEGFGKACNKGLSMASGKYVLFLNPDTIVAEDSFEKCIEAFENDKTIGATGVKMLDGRGRFLKESKRAFPSPVTSFYKLSGLAVIFPKSAKFAKYHLGNLDENSDHEADVLSGAFMMVRKTILDKLKGFDEAFFMYGEDIDLSYRIQQLGYKNLYLASSPVIHFKGESTQTASLNYVIMFYKAMGIFVNKHYGGAKKFFFIFFIHLAILLRAAITVVANIVKGTALVIIDVLVFLCSFWGVKWLWENYIKVNVDAAASLLWPSFAGFTIFYIFIVWLKGLYDKKGYQAKNVITALGISLLTGLAVYSLLPETLRFSRGIVFFGSLIGFLGIFLVRWLLVVSGVIKQAGKKIANLPTVVIGSTAGFDEVRKILQRNDALENFIGRVDLKGGKYSNEGLQNLSEEFNFKRVIFCEGTISFKDIIMLSQGFRQELYFSYHAAGSKSIVESISANINGDAITGKNYLLNDPAVRRTKRLVDVVTSLLFIISFPVHFIFTKKPLQFFKNCFNVLFAKKTWVGYEGASAGLPLLKPAVISANGQVIKKSRIATRLNHNKLDSWYALKYTPAFDVELITVSYRHLGG